MLYLCFPFNGAPLGNRIPDIQSNSRRTNTARTFSYLFILWLLFECQQNISIRLAADRA